jgi:hypothetical protein
MNFKIKICVYGLEKCGAAGKYVSEFRKNKTQSSAICNQIKTSNAHQMLIKYLFFGKGRTKVLTARCRHFSIQLAGEGLINSFYKKSSMAELKPY